MFEKMPSQKPNTPKQSLNPFEDEEETSLNPFENSEELDETNPFYEPSPSPGRSSNPFDADIESEGVTPTSDVRLSPSDYMIKDRSPAGRYNKKESPSPNSGVAKSARFEKNKSPKASSHLGSRSPKPVQSPSPISPKAKDGPAYLQERIEPTPPSLKKTQPPPSLEKMSRVDEEATKRMAKAVLSPG